MSLFLGVGESGDEAHTPVIELRMFPWAQNTLIEAFRFANEHPEVDVFRVTLFGTEEHGLHMDLDRSTLADMVQRILAASDAGTLQ